MGTTDAEAKSDVHTQTSVGVGAHTHPHVRLLSAGDRLSQLWREYESVC